MFHPTNLVVYGYADIVDFLPLKTALMNINSCKVLRGAMDYIEKDSEFIKREDKTR